MTTAQSDILNITVTLLQLSKVITKNLKSSVEKKYLKAAF